MRVQLELYCDQMLVKSCLYRSCISKTVNIFINHKLESYLTLMSPSIFDTIDCHIGFLWCLIKKSVFSSPYWLCPFSICLSLIFCWTQVYPRGYSSISKVKDDIKQTRSLSTFSEAQTFLLHNISNWQFYSSLTGWTQIEVSSAFPLSGGMPKPDNDLEETENIFCL